VRAYRQVAPDVPHALVLAGPDGAASADVDVEAARPGRGTVLRTGPLDPDDLDAVERGADLIAYVSLYEGFGLPVVEGMQRGSRGRRRDRRRPRGRADRRRAARDVVRARPRTCRRLLVGPHGARYPRRLPRRGRTRRVALRERR
jgi:hypothetical protein